MINQNLFKKLHDVKTDVSEVVYERENEIKYALITILSKVNMIMIGSPGSAKSFLVNEIMKRITNKRYFYQNIFSFTKPSEFYGSTIFSEYEKGVAVTNITGMLPDSEFGMLDEVK